MECHTQQNWLYRKHTRVKRYVEMIHTQREYTYTKQLSACLAGSSDSTNQISDFRFLCFFPFFFFFLFLTEDECAAGQRGNTAHSPCYRRVWVWCVMCAGRKDQPGHTRGTLASPSIITYVSLYVRHRVKGHKNEYRYVRGTRDRVLRHVRTTNNIRRE